MGTLRSGFCALLIAALAGCSGKSTGGGGGSSAPVSQGDFPGEIETAICENISDCCASSGIGFDRAGCGSFIRDNLLDDEPPPNTTWNPVEAGRCVSAFARLVSSCNPDSDALDACANIYEGTLPEGASCDLHEECADIGGKDAECFFDGASLTGICTRVEATVAVRGRLGDSCNQTCSSVSCLLLSDTMTGDTTCYVQDGLVCNFATLVCESVPQTGEPCPDYFCRAGAYCAMGQVCTPARADGSLCNFLEECSSGACNDGICGRPTLASPEVCVGET